MSYYDDSTLMFLAAGAVGKDGKASTVKPVGGGAPLYVTRGNNLSATRVDSNGLIEKGRENLLKQSNQFDTTWTQFNASVTSGQSGYDGSSDAWLLENTANSGRIFQSISTSGVNTFSVYVKAGTTDWVALYGQASPNQPYVYFDLTNGVVGAKEDNVIESNITSVGSGWYRISIAFNEAVTDLRIFPAASNASLGVTGDNIYIQDAQVEQGLVATEYIESGASSGKAGLLENEPRFNYPIGGGSPHLLLEPQRSNIVGYSEYFDSWNKVEVNLDFGYLAPDGTYSAYKVSALEMPSSSLYRSAVGLDNTYTRSIWARTRSGTGVVSLLSYKNNTNNVFTITDEWQRFDVSDVPEATGLGNFYAVDFRAATTTLSEVIIWGAQAEQGSYPTSYIPNHSSGSVSREAEVVQTADVSSLNLIGQNEGVFFLDYEFLDGQAAESQNWIALESENGQERVLIYKSSSNSKIQVYFVANNSLVFNANTNVTIVPNTRYKVAFKYSNGDIAVVINGSLIVTSSNTYTRGSDLSRLKFNESNIQPSCKVHQAIVLTSGWDNLDLAVLTGLTDYYASFSEMATALNYTIYE